MHIIHLLRLSRLLLGSPTSLSVELETTRLRTEISIREKLESANQQIDQMNYLLNQQTGASNEEMRYLTEARSAAEAEIEMLRASLFESNRREAELQAQVEAATAAVAEREELLGRQMMLLEEATIESNRLK